MFFPFVIHCLLLGIPNMYDSQRFKTSFKPRNIDGMTLSFSVLKMDLGWRLDNLSCQYFDSCCKVDSAYGNTIFSKTILYEIILFIYIIL